MSIRVSKEKLDDLMRQRGHNSYYDIERAAKAKGIELSYRTIYNISENRNWTRDSLVALCQALDCEVGDFVDFASGDRSPHTSPQPAERAREQVAV